MLDVHSNQHLPKVLCISTVENYIVSQSQELIFYFNSWWFYRFDFALDRKLLRVGRSVWKGGKCGRNKTQENIPSTTVFVSHKVAKDPHFLPQHGRGRIPFPRSTRYYKLSGDGDIGQRTLQCANLNNWRWNIRL